MVRGSLARVGAVLFLFGSFSVMPSDGHAEELKQFSHKGKVEVHLQGGFGYRGVFPYDGEYCGQLENDGAPRSNCIERSPFAVDIGLGFAPVDTVEFMIEARVGLERDFGTNPSTDGPRLFAVSPGFKFYLTEIGSTMLFSTLQFQVDFTDYEQVDGVDYGVRNVNGLQLDLHETIGIFAYVGEIASWRRWLRFEIEAGVGLQARFP